MPPRISPPTEIDDSILSKVLTSETHEFPPPPPPSYTNFTTPPTDFTTPPGGEGDQESGKITTADLTDSKNKTD